MRRHRRYEPPTSPEMALRRLRDFRDSGAIPTEISKIVDFHETMITLLLDIMYLRRAMSDSRAEWEQRLFGRHLALVLYEALDDMSALLPAATQDLAKSPTAEAANARRRLRDQKLSLARLQRKFAAALKPVRDATAAHRAHDVRRFREAADALDLQRLDLAVANFVDWAAVADITVTALLLRYSGEAYLADQLEAHADRIVTDPTPSTFRVVTPPASRLKGSQGGAV
jgi:hypothetical protein